MSLQMSDIGAHTKALMITKPQNSAAGAVTSDVIDRDDYDMPLSAVFVHRIGAVTGTPTSLTLATAVQHDDDDGAGAPAGTWAAYAPDGVTAATITTLTAANAEAEVDVNLIGAKRHIRLVSTLAFVDGTTPATDIACCAVLGGAGVEVV